ncbi:unnamed protein product [Paramecium octaurelia]|uniref:Uncharacterized protein n=1 Tax=Paramecium octaurelia TaxID=43137 RepID=A0A8S1Y649_PAROT|nr:unnamed protein product [Paramecium octaurelia]
MNSYLIKLRKRFDQYLYSLFKGPRDQALVSKRAKLQRGLRKQKSSIYQTALKKRDPYNSNFRKCFLDKKMLLRRLFKSSEYKI